MKKTLLIVLASFFSVLLYAQQGRYAGAQKKLLGKTYADSHSIPGLKGWTFLEGSVVTPLNNLEIMVSGVYKKGTTRVVVFSIKEDTAMTDWTIMDVLEVKAVTGGWDIKTGLCRRYQREDAAVVAMVKWTPTAEYLKPARKAWRFNMDKRRFEIIATKDVDCMNEGLD